MRKSLSIVLQDTHLFTGTVMDNIRYGRLDATDEECIEAAKLAEEEIIRKAHIPDEDAEELLSDEGENKDEI